MDNQGGVEMDRLAVRPEALFVYGTLLFPDVLVALVDRVPDRTPATAAGWRAAALLGHAYPGLVTAAGCTADGLLLTGLTLREWRVIDTFENGGYDLTELTLADGRRAWTYACTQDVVALPDDWSAERFAAHHLAEFVDRCQAWRRDFEAADRTG